MATLHRKTDGNDGVRHMEWESRWWKRWRTQWFSLGGDISSICNTGQFSLFDIVHISVELPIYAVVDVPPDLFP